MTRHRAPGGRQPRAPPSEVYDVALLDLDGVVYVGPDAVPGVSGGAGRRPRRRACGSASSPTTPPARPATSPST